MGVDQPRSATPLSMRNAPPHERKRFLTTALTRLFPGVAFEITSVDVEGRSLNGVSWEGGNGAPGMGEVRTALRDLDMEKEVTIYYNDPRLISEYDHLVRLDKSPMKPPFDQVLDNIRRHLDRAFPQVGFEVYGSQGAYGFDSSATVSWVRLGDLGPTREEVQPLVDRFWREHDPRGQAATPDDANFHRMFGGVHSRSVIPQWSPAPRRSGP